MTVGAEQRRGLVPLDRRLPRRTVCFRFNMAARAARVAALWVVDRWEEKSLSEGFGGVFFCCGLLTQMRLFVLKGSFRVILVRVGFLGRKRTVVCLFGGAYYRRPAEPVETLCFTIFCFMFVQCLCFAKGIFSL